MELDIEGVKSKVGDKGKDEFIWLSRGNTVGFIIHVHIFAPVELIKDARE